MANTMIRACVLVALVGGGAVSTGCTNKTEGERTVDMADRQRDAGNMIRRGEELVRDGKATQARGEEAKRQGDNDGGDRLVARGRAQEEEGRSLIDSGRKMKP